LPKISIIIPVYNVERYLARCLESVLTQTFSDFEIICVNDGSTDSSAAILDEYAKKDKRIKVITQPNQGISVARNNGLKVAQGQYIYFLDSDDCIHPQTLEIVHYFITNHDVDMVCFDFINNDAIVPAFNKLSLSDIPFEITDCPLYVKQFKINAWTKLYKRDILQNLEFIPHICFEDYPFTLALLSKHPKTVILKEPLYFYTIDENSISHSKAKPQHIKDYHTGLNFVYETYNKPALKEEFQYVCRTYIPNLLKQQLGRCQRADKEVRPQMFQNFAEELRDLKAKGLLNHRGHKLTRYLTYLWIMKRF